MKNKKIMWTLGTVCVLLVGILFSAYAAEPGSSEDPVVSKSYIDSVVKELKEYIDSSNGTSQTPLTGYNENFKILKLTAGQKITFTESAEFILRSGKGKIFSSAKGGVADVTDGADLANGSSLPLNHQMVIPVGDGRGFDAEGAVLVMVRGGYSIK